MQSCASVLKNVWPFFFQIFFNCKRFSQIGEFKWRSFRRRRFIRRMNQKQKTWRFSIPREINAKPPTSGEKIAYIDWHTAQSARAPPTNRHFRSKRAAFKAKRSSPTLSPSFTFFSVSALWFLADDTGRRSESSSRWNGISVIIGGSNVTRESQWETPDRSRLLIMRWHVYFCSILARLSFSFIAM